MEQKENNQSPQGGFALSKQSLYYILTGIVLIIVGFVMMSGGGSDDPNVFNPEVFNFNRITLAPILIIAGFIVNIFGIMVHPKK